MHRQMDRMFTDSLGQFQLSRRFKEVFTIVPPKATATAEKAD